MRAIGGNIVLSRYIGDKHVIARYVGEERIFIDYLRQGLIHQFDGLNNIGTGTFDPNADVWVDLVSGVEATLQDVSWLNFGVLFSSTTSKVFYSGENVQQYTIFNTHKVTSFSGSHPRIFGENPYPSQYLSSNHDYAYGLYGQDRDAPFIPHTIPTLNTVVQTAMRFGDSGLVDLFYNGILTATLLNVTAFPSPVPTMYIGCRGTNDRTFTGEIYEHLVYNRPLDNDAIYHNFLVSKQRYSI